MIFRYHIDREANIVYLRGDVLRPPTLHTRGNIIVPRATLLGLSYLQGVAQLVARTAGGREVASSSLVTLTIEH